MQKTVVINAVGLTPSLIGDHTPRLRAFRDAGALAHVGHVLPAVTTTVQSTYLTGTWPTDGKMKVATFGPVAARYVRLEATSANGSNAAP